TLRADSGSAITTQRGRQPRACSHTASQLVWALSPNTARRWGRPAMTSRQLTPMDPVDPRTITRRKPGMAESGTAGGAGTNHRVQDRKGITGRPGIAAPATPGLLLSKIGILVGGLQHKQVDLASGPGLCPHSLSPGARGTVCAEVRL